MIEKVNKGLRPCEMQKCGSEKERNIYIYHYIHQQHSTLKTKEKKYKILLYKIKYFFHYFHRETSVYVLEKRTRPRT